MKKEVDLEAIHPLETHTPSSRSHTETSPMTKMEMDPRRPSQQMDSSHSASPVTATTLPRNIINNAHEVGQGLVHQDDRNLANSGEFHFSVAFYCTCKHIFKFKASKSILLSCKLKINVLDMARIND